jgi:preprotein translocase subunit YajC
MLAVFWTLLADADAAPKGTGEPAWSQMMPLLLIGLSFLIFIVLPMRRDKRQRQELINSVEKGDRVIVNGAIVGTVVQIDKAEAAGGDDQFLVKIDENANIKMRVLRSGVTGVIKKAKDSKDGA